MVATNLFQPTNAIEFDSLTSALAASIPSIITGFSTLGYSSPVDQGGSSYYRIEAPSPVKAWHVQTADGSYWQLSPRDVNVQMLGAVGDGVTDDTTAIQNAIEFVESFDVGSIAAGSRLFFPSALYKTSSTINVTSTILIEGAGQLASAVQITTGTVFYITGDNVVIRGIFIPAASAGTVNGMSLSTANNCIIERCFFQSQATAITMEDSYAVEIIGNIFDVATTYGVYAATSCHNLMVTRNGFFTIGGTTGAAVRLDVASDNIGIKDNDFEYCAYGVYLNSCTAVEITGNYLEYNNLDHIFFDGTCRSVKIENNWLALGTSSGATIDLANIVGGTFRLNRLYDQTIVFDSATLVGFDVGYNYLSGTGSIGAAPWISPTLLNSWAQQTNYSIVGYIKDADNWVHIRGALVTGTAPSVLFTLPVGYRPTSILEFATQSVNGACAIEIRTNGEVYATTAASNNAGLDGIRFQVTS